MSEAWLAFARENAAPEIGSPDAVLGHSIWEFISGKPTRDLYDVIFRRVRGQGETIALPFRCDSPRTYRFMRLVAAPTQGGGISLQGVLIREQDKPCESILDRLFPRSEVSLPMCSVCKRVRLLEKQWVEVEEAVARLDLFDSSAQPSLEYSVCDDCLSQAREAC